MMLHYGQNYICYTRNGINYTNHYQTLAPFFKDAFTNLGGNCILDGEVVLMDKITREIFPKANMTNGTKKDNYDMCFIIFDILFINDKSIN